MRGACVPRAGRQTVNVTPLRLTVSGSLAQPAAASQCLPTLDRRDCATALPVRTVGIPDSEFKYELMTHFMYEFMSYMKCSYEFIAL